MPTDPAEAIAAAVADIRAGRVAELRGGHTRLYGEVLAGARRPMPVVDATAIYNTMVYGRDNDVYASHPHVLSPWPDALICYVNEHGNANVLHVRRFDWPDGDRWESQDPVDWDRVRWGMAVTVWTGGHGRDPATGKVHPIPMAGPIHVLRYAVYEDGRPGLLNWLEIENNILPFKEALSAGRHVKYAVVGATMNFLSCRNVEIAEPRRPYPVRKRIRDTRVQVDTIVVRPPGKQSAARGDGAGRPVDQFDSPLRPVRGYFAEYGAEYGKGKLFGKYSGRFWIEAHTRGGKEKSTGGPESWTYDLRPGKNGGGPVTSPTTPTTIP